MTSNLQDNLLNNLPAAHLQKFTVFHYADDVGVIGHYKEGAVRIENIDLIALRDELNKRIAILQDVYLMGLEFQPTIQDCFK